jgi:class 3 adenylate cyclase/tetratricopeptide (TPR) repeat protein
MGSTSSGMSEREQLEQAITIQESLRAALGDAVVDATITALRAKIAGLEEAPPVEQRKQATVLFADISGYTAISETMDAEEVKEMMNALWDRLDNVITGIGGTVVAHMGDAVMAVWGAQTAQEDDPERAIHAALAMQREVREFRPPFPVIRPIGTDPNSPLLRMRVGINTGPVILGNVATTQEFTALGDTTNLASRLEHAAPVGGVLIAHDTYRQVRGAFEVQPQEPMAVKGKVEPIKTYVVERAKPRAFRAGTRGVEGVETTMVGRAAELGRMLNAVQSVINDGQPQVVTVIAEAGIGKSRLLYEFNNRIELMPEHIQIFNARATESTRGVPFALARDLFSFRFEILDSDPADLAHRKLEAGIASTFDGEADALVRAHFIGQLIGLDYSSSPHLSGIITDVKQIRDRAFHYVRQFFEAAAKSRPLVVYLDDLHWADEGSLDLIEHLVRTGIGIPMMIVGLTRPLLLEKRPAWGEAGLGKVPLRLQPLSSSESGQLVEDILRQVEDVPPELRELVVGGAEGNPFYVEELIKMLIDQKVIEPGEDRWRVDSSRLATAKVPPTLTGVLQARLDGLAVHDKAVLQRAAVVGREFWDRALEYLRAESQPMALEITPSLDSLRKSELIYWRSTSSFADTNEYIFKHALLRDVTYESVLIKERRAYHQRIAGWLVDRSGERVGQYAATIAEHFEQARDYEAAAEWYGRAGKQAREAYAAATAIGYYQKAIEFSAQLPSEIARRFGPRRLRWYEGLAEALWWQARFDDAVAAYGQMRTVAQEQDNVLAEARACNGLALVQERRGDNRASLESANLAEQLARNAESSPAAGLELAAAINRMGSVSYRLGDFTEALARGEQALLITGPLGHAGRRERAGGLRVMGISHLLQGNFEEAYSYIEQARDLYDQLGDRRGVSNMLTTMGETARQRGDYPKAAELYQQALTIAREIGEHTSQIICLNNLGGVRVGMGDHDAAIEDLRQVISMAGPSGYQVLSETYSFLAVACLGLGRPEEALEAAQRALHLGKKMENQELIAEAWRTLGLVAAKFDGPIEADEACWTAPACFGESLALFTETGMQAGRARTLRDWSRYETAFGQTDSAVAKMTEAREIFLQLGMNDEITRLDAPSN